MHPMGAWPDIRDLILPLSISPFFDWNKTMLPPLVFYNISDEKQRKSYLSMSLPKYTYRNFSKVTDSSNVR